MFDLKTGIIPPGGVSGGDRDLIIAGGGPAALAAALYAARYDIEHVVIESYQPGGQAALTALIENYPGIAAISGGELTAAFRKQAVEWGAVFESGSVLSTAMQDERILVATDSGEYSARSLIIATGAAPAKLGIPGEDEFYGRGVSYCATCDAPFFRDRHVVVVGGGDSAVKEALHLAGVVSGLTLIHRRDRLRAEPYLAEKLMSCSNCEMLWNSNLKEIHGADGVESVLVETPDGIREIKADGVFMYVGRKPATDPFRELVELNPNGTVKTERIVHTSHPNVFAAGDVTDNELRQVITAVADGARAASAVFELLQG